MINSQHIDNQLITIGPSMILAENLSGLYDTNRQNHG